MASSSSSRTSHRLLLVAAATLFSTGGAAIKATQFNAWQVSTFRSSIAAVVIALLVPAALRGLQWRIVPIAVAYALTVDLFVGATKLTTAANAIFLQSTAPLYVLLFSPLLLKEKIRRKDLSLILAVGAGMALFFLGDQHPQATAPDPVRGNLLAACSGMAYGFTLIGMRWIARSQKEEGNSLGIVVLGNVFAGLICAPLAFPVTGARLQDWAVVLFLGVIQIGLGYICLTRALAHVQTLEASSLMMLEPVLNSLEAWLIHGETMSRAAVLGGALIIGATLTDVWWASREKTAPEVAAA